MEVIFDDCYNEHDHCAAPPPAACLAGGASVGQMAQERVNRFEATYATTLEDLETQGLPDDAGYQMHEDFIEWEHWHDVAVETGKALGQLESSGEKPGGD